MNEWLRERIKDRNIIERIKSYMQSWAGAEHIARRKYNRRTKIIIGWRLKE